MINRRFSMVAAGLIGTMALSGIPVPASAAEVPAVGPAEASGGILVLLGDATGRQAIETLRRTGMTVYSQLPESADVEQARRATDAAGLLGTKIFIDKGNLSHLHLADNIADLVIAAGTGLPVPESEVLRVLRPQGKAILGTREIIKPFPEGVDDWSHVYHGPDNNPQSRDRVARWPYLTQFLGDPRYAPMPQATVASTGRVFKAFGHVAFKPREEEFLNTLVCFNGYNGSILWKRELTPGIMVDRNTMIATPEVLYLGDDKSCKLIDAATGKLRDEIVPPPDRVDGTFWKWMGMENGVLYAVVGEKEHQDKTMRWNRQAHGWPWDKISQGYNQPNQPWGFGRTLVAIDPKTKAVRWCYREEDPIDCRAVCMKDGRIYVFHFGTYLTCVDAKTGKPIWRKTPDDDPDLFDALGKYKPRQGWETNWRTVTYLKCSDKALYFAGPQMGKLLAVSADDGGILWENPYNNFQLILRDDGLYGISGPWGNNQSKKLDPLTGVVLADLGLGRRACTRATGSIDGIFNRAMGGSMRLDPASVQTHYVSPMRPSCQDGVTVANGLLYWWPMACDCQLTLFGVTCLGPAGKFDFYAPAVEAERLERFEAAGDAPTTSAGGSTSDWPTFRANNQCTATSAATIAGKSELLWQVKPAVPDGVTLTAPVTVDGIIYVGGSDGIVRALDAASGKERWKAYTGGAICLPPAIADGRAFVGSGDGWIYAYEAASGRPIWRFRAAPAERFIPVYGALLSTWPAAGGPIVHQGTVYIAAGIVNYDGTYVYALDAATGRIKWQNTTSGHLDREAHTGVSVQGHLLIHGDKLYLAGGNAVSPAVYSLADGRCLNDPAQLRNCESAAPRGWELFLVGDKVVASGKPYWSSPKYPVVDVTVFEKMLHASNGRRDITWLNNKELLCFEPIDRDELSRCVNPPRDRVGHIIPPWGKLKVSNQPLWEHECDGSAAVALCGNAAVVATATEVRALSLADGKVLWSQPLPAAPVPWGLAVDRAGRVIVTLDNGQVACFGQGA